MCPRWLPDAGPTASPPYLSQPGRLCQPDRRRRSLHGQHGFRHSRAAFRPRVILARCVVPRRPVLGRPMRFIEAAPTFAVEVRSENDYGDAAELEFAAKRADYFLAGTPVVWDVDTVNERIHVYRAPQPTQPVVYQRGETAEAEPVVPGWRVAVDWIFS
ncbi:MAG: Uma2 family endonuclease [Gemmataceae bacterium]|nr:Uma2 family endonuclease [Gemmataceae bacterium]